MDGFRQKWSGALDSDSTHFFFAYYGDVWRRYYYNVMVTTYKVRDSRKRKKNSWQLTKKLGCARVPAAPDAAHRVKNSKIVRKLLLLATSI